MKARAARGPCRRRRSGNGRRGGGAGQVRAGRQRGTGPLRGRGSLPAQGSHCGEVSGAFWGAGARRGRVRPGGAGEGRRAPRGSRALIRGQGSGSARRGSLPGQDCLGNVRFAERCEGLAWVLLLKCYPVRVRESCVNDRVECSSVCAYMFALWPSGEAGCISVGGHS